MLHDVFIVGLGKIGIVYDINHSNDFILSHARAFDVHKSFNIVSGVDIATKRSSLFNAKYSERVKTYSDVNTALDNTNAFAFVVSTPADSHYNIIK